MTTVPGDHPRSFRRASADAGDSAPPPGGKRVPPPWMINIGKTVLVGLCSTIVGAVTAVWNVRGSIDDARAHQERTDLKIDLINGKVDDLRQDFRDLRGEMSAARNRQ